MYDSGQVDVDIKKYIDYTIITESDYKIRSLYLKDRMIGPEHTKQKTLK